MKKCNHDLFGSFYSIDNKDSVENLYCQKCGISLRQYIAELKRNDDCATCGFRLNFNTAPSLQLVELNQRQKQIDYLQNEVRILRGEVDYHKNKKRDSCGCAECTVSCRGVHDLRMLKETNETLSRDFFEIQKSKIDLQVKYNELKDSVMNIRHVSDTNIIQKMRCLACRLSGNSGNVWH